MSANGEIRIREMLARQEGLELEAYPDGDGWAIGYGHNFTRGIPNEGDWTVEFRPIEARDRRMKISVDFAEHLLDLDIRTAQKDLERVFGEEYLKQLFEMSEARYWALVNMMFNLGQPRFEGFKIMIHFLQAVHFPAAAMEMLDSKAARKLPGRYRELAVMVYTGRWEEDGRN